MKKIIFAALAAALAFGINAQAQSFDYTRFGITAGVTSSNSQIKNVTSKSISLYHAGVALEIPLGAGFALQPEVLYQVKGMSLNNVGDSSAKDIGNSLQAKVGYVEVPFQIQWGPDLVAFRPYGFVEPFLGYQITSGGDKAAKTLNDNLQKIEYGMSLGAGIDVWHLQFAAKYFWNFGNVYKSDIENTGSTIGGLFKDGNNFNGIAFSVALFF